MLERHQNLVAGLERVADLPGRYYLSPEFLGRPYGRNDDPHAPAGLRIARVRYDRSIDAGERLVCVSHPVATLGACSAVQSQAQSACRLLELLLTHVHHVAERTAAVGHARGGEDVHACFDELFVNAREGTELVVALHE